MPRKKREVMPGIAHHIVQRGTRRELTFFSDKDYSFYLKLLYKYSKKLDVEIIAYCLMPNHIHLILTPSSPNSLSSVVGRTHKIYSQYINQREGWQGHLWQERFYSIPLDELHLDICVNYIHLNPVKAGLAKRVEEYPWSSAWENL